MGGVKHNLQPTPLLQEWLLQYQGLNRHGNPDMIPGNIFTRENVSIREISTASVLGIGSFFPMNVTFTRLLNDFARMDEVFKNQATPRR